MALVRSILAAASIAVLAAGSARAGETARAAALSVCPSGTGECVEIVLRWDYARTDSPPFVDSATGATTHTLRIRGRLGEGPVQWLRLAVTSTKTARRNRLGVVAYLGRSREGRPIILTDHGPLTIETRGLQVGRAGAVVIVDERVGKIVESFLGGLDAGTYVMRDHDHAVVLSKSGACLSPLLSRPGLLKSAATCGDQSEPAVGFGFSERIVGAIATAPDADLAMLRRLLPQTRELDDATLRAKVGRLDEHHLVVTPWAD